MEQGHGIAVPDDKTALKPVFKRRLNYEKSREACIVGHSIIMKLKQSSTGQNVIN